MPSALCRCSIAILPAPAHRRGRPPPMVATPAAPISLPPRPAALPTSPSTRSAAPPLPRWSRALGSTVVCATSAPACGGARRQSLVASFFSSSPRRSADQLSGTRGPRLAAQSRACGYRKSHLGWADAAMGYPHFGMIDLLKRLGGSLVGVFRSHAAREAEMSFLRQQLVVLQRSAPARLRLRTADRLIFVWLYRLFPSLLEAAVVFKPATLVRWHRSGFRLYWRCKSRRRVGRPAVPADIRDLILTISRDKTYRGPTRCL